MRKVFDKNYIESLGKEDNSTFSENLSNVLYNVLSLVIERLSTSVPFITVDNVIIQPINETFNGGITTMSKYQYFLGVASPQLEYNTLHSGIEVKKYWKNFVKAWKDTRWKSKRRLKKELLKKQLQNPEYEAFEPEKYNMNSFKKDLQSAISENLSNTSIIYNLSDRLIIQGKDDFGSIAQIEIIPTIFDGNKYKYFVNKRKGFIEIDMDERLLNFNIKYEIVGDNFIKAIKIFNILFKNLTKEIPNQFFIESLLYNVPDELFNGKDIYNVIINIVNYLNMTNIEDFVAIENKSKKIFKTFETRNSVIIYNKFMKNI